MGRCLPLNLARGRQGTLQFIHTELKGFLELLAEVRDVYTPALLLWISHGRGIWESFFLESKQIARSTKNKPLGLTLYDSKSILFLFFPSPSNVSQ